MRHQNLNRVRKPLSTRSLTTCSSSLNSIPNSISHSISPPIISSLILVHTGISTSLKKVNLFPNRIQIIKEKKNKVVSEFKITDVTAIVYCTKKKRDGLNIFTELKDVQLYFDDRTQMSQWLEEIRKRCGRVKYFLRGVVSHGEKIHLNSESKKGNQFVISSHCLYILNKGVEAKSFIVQSYDNKKKGLEKFFRAVNRVIPIRNLKSYKEETKSKTRITIITTKADKIILSDDVETIFKEISRISSDSKLQSELEQNIENIKNLYGKEYKEECLCLIDVMGNGEIVRSLENSKKRLSVGPMIKGL